MERTEEKENAFCWLRLLSGQRSVWEKWRNDLKDIECVITSPRSLISDCHLVQRLGFCRSPDALKDMVLELALGNWSEP